MGKHERIEAEALGGSGGETRATYENPDELAYFDKPHHLVRSLRHQPNHKKAVVVKELLEEIPEVLL